MLTMTDPMTRPTGWYDIMRRQKKGTFKARETAFWERKYDKSYGEWNYQNGEIRPIEERMNDDLVLGEAND